MSAEYFLDDEASPPRKGQAPTIVGLGEALFDCYPSRSELGGAPLNVALHAQALLTRVGGRGLPATRVGDDSLGKRFFEELKSRGLSGSAVQIDAAHPTGRVQVEIDADRHAAYRFEADVAWDHFDFSPGWARLAASCDAVAFGSLAQRSPKSREVIAKFLAAAQGAIRLFDVNLRGEFYSAEILQQSLEMATAVKLNSEELTAVFRTLDLASRVEQDLDEQVNFLCLTFGLDWLALTRGAQGTCLYCQGDKYEVKAPQSEYCDKHSPDADSVGAGDACCASLLVGMLLKWPPLRTLELANHVGAFVASRAGATPQLPSAILSRVTPLNTAWDAAR